MRDNNKETKVIIGVNSYIGSELGKYFKQKNLKLPNTEFYCSKHVYLSIFYGMKIKQAHMLLM